jgi:hypothetical protein
LPRTGAPGGTYFHVRDGQIVDPDGRPFVARGINIYSRQIGEIDTILSRFPGLNMIRVATPKDLSAASLAGFVDRVTANHIVVEIEHHARGGNPNTLARGALHGESEWYAFLARAFKGNPYVWFGTMNEPDNSRKKQAIVDQELATYHAIRATGNGTIILLELRGGSWTDFLSGRAAQFAELQNVVWDAHFYGWVAHYSKNQAQVDAALRKMTDALQSVQSADGMMPVIIGEYGVSTSGLGRHWDPNWLQVLTSVQKSGFGWCAWAWNAGTDSLSDGAGNLNAYGRQVAKAIVSGR